MHSVKEKKKKKPDTFSSGKAEQEAFTKTKQKKKVT